MNHPNPKRVLPVLLVLLLAAAAYWTFGRGQAAAETGRLTASGTIEATMVRISAEMAGRALEVLVEEGQAVAAGDPLIRFDQNLLAAQLKQAEAAAALAQANYELVAAGLPEEQQSAKVAAAEMEVLAAQQAVDSLNERAELMLAQAEQSVLGAQNALDLAQDRLDNLPEAAEDDLRKKTEADVRLAQAQLAEAERQVERLENGPDVRALELAQARLAAAQGQLAAAQSGASVEQLAAAQKQVEAAQAAVAVVRAQMEKLNITAPLDGLVMTRAIEPGELAMPGAPLLTITDLSNLTITVYIPEDRYGEIRLGQEAQVMVDSFPGQVFTARVVQIATEAEFTPRNVQTAEGRRTTVFAVKLRLDDADGKLKPGMPADVDFGD